MWLSQLPPSRDGNVARLLYTTSGLGRRTLQFRLGFSFHPLPSLNKTPGEFPIWSHQVPYLLRLFTACLPQRISRRNPLHDHAITKRCKCIPPVHFWSWIPFRDFSIPLNALGARRQARSLTGWKESRICACRQSSGRRIDSKGVWRK